MCQSNWELIHFLELHDFMSMNNFVITNQISPYDKDKKFVTVSL